ncbi:unnamed protein product [Prorocentrum cordatum]|uniref:Peptidylprolyl isomerase n=1 Tax=Prorocentrum cordatum TaxID=2364126 RepID=A0ABN9S5F4_9DINO|nr:unnamed protein product [Polarella glacialis]
MAGMKLVTLALAAASAHAAAVQASPIGKVIEMLGDLEAKVIGEGEESHKVFAEFSEWCEDKARSLGFSIKTASGEIASLKATIAKEGSNIDGFNTKIEELAAELALDTADLKAATEIRAKEQSDFAAEEAELSDVVGTLERAIGILEKEMAKGAGASMLQMAGEGGVVGALRAMVQASLLSTADEKKLAALVQGDFSRHRRRDARVVQPAQFGGPRGRGEGRQLLHSMFGVRQCVLERIGFEERCEVMGSRCSTASNAQHVVDVGDLHRPRPPQGQTSDQHVAAPRSSSFLVGHFVQVTISAGKKQPVNIKRCFADGAPKDCPPFLVMCGTLLKRFVV